MSSRREFIKNGLFASSLATIHSPLQELFAADKTNGNLPSWKELVEYARWCPTVHNLQPHRVKIISDTEAQLYYEPGRLLPVGDPNAIFVTVAMGIFIEHLSIVAGYNGYKVVVKEIFDPLKTATAGLTKFAGLRLVPAENKVNLDRELIKKRRTSRLHYSGEPLSDKTLGVLKDEAARAGHKVFWSSDKKMVDYVIGLNQQTLFEDLGSKANRDELGRLFRYSDEEAEVKKDGLWAKCMCFPGKLLKSVFTRHEKWEQGLRKKLLATLYKKSFNGTHTICWICGKFENTADWLNAGRTFARSWLLLTGYGAYIHPFGSLITNNEAYKKINEVFTRPVSDEKIWMIFRAGYSSEPVRSYRISTEEIIIN